MKLKDLGLTKQDIKDKVSKYMVKCRMRVPFVTQESLFVNENLIL